MEPRDLSVEEISLTINNGPNSISGKHPQGPNTAFADGSVRPLNPSIDPRVLGALLTKAGGEFVADF